jgi:hypothetical protein
MGLRETMRRRRVIEMQVSRDLCIALVLAVIGVGMTDPVLGSDADDDLDAVEEAMADGHLSEEEIASVRTLIAEARERHRAGDDDGAAAAMARVSAILGIA